VGANGRVGSESEYFRAERRGGSDSEVVAGEVWCGLQRVGGGCGGGAAKGRTKGCWLALGGRDWAQSAQRSVKTLLVDANSDQLPKVFANLHAFLMFTTCLRLSIYVSYFDNFLRMIFRY
jgi:hypothetical protein